MENTEYKKPEGAGSDVTWTNEAGKTSEVEITSDWIVLRKKEKPAAEMFHTYYRLADGKGDRPLTFVFNGGPGAASAFLHIGGLGPQRVEFGAQGQLLAPPARLLNNPESWIEFTDLVFVDPVGTGFSRIIEAEKSEKEPKPDEKEFFGVNRDLESLGEFIERFLSKHRLWHVPVYIAGESYGGFRSAKLARRLQEKHGVGLSAAICISPALEYALLYETDYDTLRFIDTFCAMALASVQLGKSRAIQAGTAIEQARRDIEAFATRDLAHALTVGTIHDEGEQRRVYARAADFLGLSEEIVTRSHGRVPFWRYSREILRDQRRVVGWYDATITGIDPFPDREASEAPDPTLVGIGRIFESGINNLLRGQIGVESERRYESLSFEVFNGWKRDDLKHGMDGPAGATDDLRFAMSLNPDMKVLITHGYYDLVTPYFSSERLVAQMKLAPEQRRNLHLRHFGGGHMFYTWDRSRKDFRDWVRGFYT